MIRISRKTLIAFTAGSFMFSAGVALSQTSMAAEFKAMPAFPTDVKEAFTASKVTITSDNCFYKESSDPVHAYIVKLQNDSKPYQAAILAKGQKGTPTGIAVANDFSDLSSPEMQAKLAKMSQEEKMKFAMEMQERMKSNTNVQAANALTRPSPLTGIVLKLSKSAEALAATLTPYGAAAPLKYDACNFNCGEFDKICSEKVAACNHRVSQAYYNAEIMRYNAFIKAIPPQYDLKKKAFEDDLKEFDKQAASYSLDETAADYSNVITMLYRIARMVENYEKEGAMILVDAKNNPYCRKDF
jgi:hypothetical protein